MVRARKQLTEAELAAELQRKVNIWQWSHYKFCKQCLKVEPSNQQKDASDKLSKFVRALCLKESIAKETDQAIVEKHKKELDSDPVMQEYQYKRGISIRSGNGTGKDAWCSWVAPWFLLLHKYNGIGSKSYCLAPVERQLKHILWPEIETWVRRRNKDGDYVFPFQEYVHIQGESIYGSDANGLNKTNFITQIVAPMNADEAQIKSVIGGRHGPRMMLIFDEATGINDAVFDAAIATMSDPVNFAILIFNPHRRTGFALDTHFNEKISKDWISLHWDAEFSDRVPIDHINSIAEQKGRESDYFRVHVKGLPPKGSKESLIPYEWVYDATQRDIPESVYKDYDLIFGVDPSGEGKDKTVICVRQGPKIHDFIQIGNMGTIELAEAILQKAEEWDCEHIYIDGIGVGAGVFHILNESRFLRLCRNVESYRSASSDKFRRLRDEIWWKARAKFEAGSIDLPYDAELIEQLAAVNYREDESNGRIIVDKKKDIKKKLNGKSPDKADALVISLSSSDVFSVRRKINRYKKSKEQEAYDDLEWMTL